MPSISLAKYAWQNDRVRLNKTGFSGIFLLRSGCAIKLRNRPAKTSENAAATTLTSALTQRSDFL